MRNEVTGVFESHNAYEREKRWRKIFHQVTAAYLDARNTPALVAVNYDDSQPGNRKLGADLIHYIADCERTARAALGGNPVLFGMWQRLVEENDTVPAAMVAQIIRKFGRLAQARGLEPHRYFTHIRKGRPDKRPKVAGAA